MKITVVEFVYVEFCYKNPTSKYEKSNSDINISKMLHLPFDMLCYLLEHMMTLCQMHQQSASILKRPVVQNCAKDTTKLYLTKVRHVH